MKREYEDDLFQDSTMTFGQHLEELRTCLFKAAIGLAIGVLLGLALSRYVVELIKAPMERALLKDIALRDEERYIEQLEALGAEIPAGGIKKDPQYQLLRDRNLTYQTILVDPERILDALGLDRSLLEGSEKSKSSTDSDGLISIRVMTPLADDPRAQFTFLSGQEPFVIFIKAGFVAGFIFASPWIFYQIWNFVAAGLYPHEKHFVNIFLPFSLGLFLLGASTAYLFVFDPVLQFLFGFGRWLGFRPEMRISEWLSLVLFLPLGFGISFQLPLVMLFLERIGVFSLNVYLQQWRVAILVICIISMLATPADPYSMLLLAAPLSVLYGAGIALCKFLPRDDRPHGDDDDLD